MKFKTTPIITLIFILLTNHVNAQIDSALSANIELRSFGTIGGTVPFWMRSNQYGAIPLEGLSGSVQGNLYKQYRQANNSDIKPKLFDWGFGANVRVNGGRSINLQVIEAYGKVRLGIFQAQLGRTKDVMGLNGDTILSSGNFSVSGTSAGIPKLELAIPEFYRLKLFKGLFSIKGTFSNGWLGKERVYLADATLKDRNIYPQTFFHQKSLYIKLGKEHWNLNLIGGFNHQVYWDDQKAAYGSLLTISPLETFFYVATGKTYTAPGIPGSKVGNQLGSIDLGAEYKFKDVRILLYRQNIYEVGALSKFANIADGLNGVALENLDYNSENDSFQWKKILLELFYTKNQAGYPWSKKTASGDEDYYNNYYFRNGWVYNGENVGNPLLTQSKYALPGQAEPLGYNFINNRVIAFHIGSLLAYKTWTLQTKGTYSRNYGTFGTSIYGISTGSIRTPAKDIFIPVNQLSIMIEAIKKFNGNSMGGISFYADKGKLLRNSSGFELKFIKSILPKVK